jgi:predicted O-methyltransferase YrrM
MTSETINRLQQLTQKANGMLPLDVYQEIYLTTAAHRPRTILEIGTAHGAATIAIGLAAQTKHSDFKIWTVDKLGGRFSSRSVYGSVETNRAIVNANLASAGLSERVQLFVGDSDDFAGQSFCPLQIDLLMLDADGRIDRDLFNFYPRLAVDAPVIIDDADDSIWLSRNHERVPFIDNKHRVTELLLSGFCDAGFLVIEKRIGCTAFCRKTDKVYDEVMFSKIALAAYRQIVSCEVDDDRWKELARWNECRVMVREGLQIRKRVPSCIFTGLSRVWSLLRRLHNVLTGKSNRGDRLPS